MGTRSLTHVKDGDQVICTIYRQMDGYPSGHGADLKEILGKMQLTNGYSDEALPAFANGMGCLAAYLVGKLKDGKIGGIYLYPPGAANCGEDYVYTIASDGNTRPSPGEYQQITLHCSRPEGDVIYDGQFADFSPDDAD